jgi:zinc protease
MMFRGTKAYPPEKYQEIITKAGARQNAYTSDDLTITTRRLPRMTWKPC